MPFAKESACHNQMRKIIMKTIISLAGVGVFATSIAAAQTSTFDTQGAAADAVDDLSETIAEDADRDIDAFGNEGRAIGTYGSIALRFSATTNDGDNETDAGVGMRYSWFDGVNGVDINLSYAYASNDGTVTKNQLLAGIDYRRDFTPAIFAYGQGDLAVDRLTEVDGEFTTDIFLGAGVGYRIVNTENVVWSVQAGPGARVSEVAGESDVKTEAAASASSNLFYSLSDTVYATNDTDVNYSETATTLSNTLAVNFALNDALSLRSSYSTRFNDQTDDSFSDAENTFGLSVVYNFN